MTRGVVLDLEGTLHIGDRPIPGAAEAVAAMRERGVQCRFLTNTTTRSIASLHARVTALGLAIGGGELLSAPQAAVQYLRRQGSPRCLLLLNDDVRADFAEFPQSETGPEVIVVGDIGARWDAELMQRLFGMMLAGARLVTLHKGRYWEAGDGLRIDIGAFVAALEFASGQQATVIGKPSPELFRLALESMQLEAGEVAMVGDDVDSDVRAAQSLGMTGILVKTGKYRPELAGGSGRQPDAVLDSVRQLPGWFDARC
jgi:HAD superfamily hydrolase (TIGR01458 family)